MALSTKQYLFAEYLLKKIGFNDSDLINNYLNKLEAIYGKYYKEWRQEINKSGYVSEYSYLRYSNSECIEELLKEIEIKKNLDLIKTENIDFSAKISATDLSNFDFCPSSYSISKSFQIEYPTTEDKRLIGINLHESLRLINKKIPERFSESDLFGYDIIHNENIKKIKNCELIFAGHTDEKKFFINEDKNFIGQPDYIFKDPKGDFFIVEEKFKYLNDYINTDNNDYESILKYRESLKRNFFSNHIIQIQSYIDYIQEYNIKYGVLIYWFYDFQNNCPNVHSVSLKVIKKNEYHNLLQSTLENLTRFRIEKVSEFTQNVNPNKCAACTVNKYCAHKTNKFQNLKLPYNKYDIKLKFAEFPEELKKEKSSNVNSAP